MRFVLFILAFAALGLVWKATPLSDYTHPAHIADLLEQIRDSDLGIPAALGIYIAGTLLFFPHSVMTIAMVLAFSPLEAVFIVIIGSLISAAAGYAIGRKLGMGSLRLLTGTIAEKIARYTKNGGIAGLTLLRMIPTGPFTAVNLVLGMSKAPFAAFMIATVLGLLPGTMIGAFLGSTVTSNWKDSFHQNMIYIALCLAGWIALIIGTHLLSRAWHKKYGAAA